uniref:Uncharacterized protein n=1 Tax=Daphnia galeata TaxID=27404 RepID=A0A8J2S1J5_9CRUS|nr:unnamed protein product [Daphnia galeata]
MLNLFQRLRNGHHRCKITRSWTAADSFVVAALSSLRHLRIIIRNNFQLYSTVCLKELVTLGSSSNRPGFSELPNVDCRICFDGGGRFSEHQDRRHFPSSGAAYNPSRSNSTADLSHNPAGPSI